MLRIRSEPYWRLISEGCHIGYYRGARVGKWVARYRRPGSANGYSKHTLGEADDIRDADGETILTFNEADAKARRWFEECSNYGGHRSTKTVGDALDAYLDGFTGKSLAKTKGRIESVIRPALGKIKLSALTRQAINDWHKARGRSPAKLRTKKGARQQNERPTITEEAIRSRRATANRDLTVLKAALNRFAENHHGLPVHSWREVKPFKGVDTPKLRYLSDDESRRLVNGCDPLFRPMVQAALLTGARYGELAALRAKNVDLKSRTVWLPTSKGGKPRFMILEDEGLRLFERAIAGKDGDAVVFPRRDGTQWKASQQQRYLQRASKNGQVEPPAGIHDLRRTYGSRLAMKGVDMEIIAEAMGADVRIVRKHYAHLAPSYVSARVREGVAGLGIVAEDSKIATIRHRTRIR